MFIFLRALILLATFSNQEIHYFSPVNKEKVIASVKYIFNIVCNIARKIYALRL